MDGKSLAALVVFVAAVGLMIWQRSPTRDDAATETTGVDKDENYYWDHFEYDKAIALLDARIAQDGNDDVAYSNRGLNHLSKGEADAALADLDKAIAIGRVPDATVNAYSNRGIVYDLKGDYPRALADDQKAIELRPDDFRRYRDLAFLHFNHADYAAAEQDFSRNAGLAKDADAVALHYLVRARLGRDAMTSLKADAAGLTDKSWPYPVIPFYLGDTAADGLLAAATNRGQNCEARFHIGEKALLEHRLDAARTSFKAAADVCPRDFDEYHGAVAELSRMDAKP